MGPGQLSRSGVGKSGLSVLEVNCKAKVKMYLAVVVSGVV